MTEVPTLPRPLRPKRARPLTSLLLIGLGWLLVGTPDEPRFYVFRTETSLTVGDRKTGIFSEALLQPRWREQQRLFAQEVTFDGPAFVGPDERPDASFGAVAPAPIGASVARTRPPQGGAPGGD